MTEFDFDATFGDDYLHFYLPMLDDARNDAEAAEIITALDLKAGEDVLDAPCGHGRIANRLARHGMRVVGIDRTPQFLDLARHDAQLSGVAVDYRHGDITEFPHDLDGRFDAAINWFTSFGYHDDTTCQSILVGYHRMLRPGGRLLIETLHRDWIVRHYTPAPFAAVTRIGDDLMLDQNTFDPRTGRINTVRSVVRDGQVRQSNHFVRLPTATELATWLEHADFHDITISARDGTPLTVESRRLLALARA